MPIYKQDVDGRFVPFEKTPFPDLEKVLEDWIEANPHLLLEGEKIAIFARQPRTRFDKYLDLLGVDQTGATVVIELKRGETPRDVLAQTLEYAAWIDSLGADQLNELAKEYALKRGLEAQTLSDIYNRTFGANVQPEAEEVQLSERITFNNRQRLIVVAEHISDEVEQTLRYLRTRFGAEVYGVEFSVHRAGGEIIISTTTIVGREQVSKAAQPWVPRERESEESISARVKTEFLQQTISGIREWAEGLRIEGLTVDHSTASDHFIRFLGVTIVYYYYASNWLYMSLSAPAQDEIDLLKTRLTKKEELRSVDGGKYWRFHAINQSDLDTVEEVVLARIRARRGPE